VLSVAAHIGYDALCFMVDGNNWFSGLVRSCGTALAEECKEITGLSIPEAGAANSSGTFCYCTSDLCNGPPDRGVPRTTRDRGGPGPGVTCPNSAARISAGGLGVTVIIALFAARI